MESNKLNKDVTEFLDSMGHPMRNEFEFLRKIIMSSSIEIKEGIKWNGPNYSIGNEDRITLRINPQKQIQVIFHRGSKVKKQPEQRLLQEDYSILTWKEKDRAVATFKSINEIEENCRMLKEIIIKWLVVSI